MMRNAIVRIALAIGALSVAACGGQSNSIPGSGVNGPTYATEAGESRPLSLLAGAVPAQAQETVLHSFAGGSDGEYPQTDLTGVDGVLYGTTYSGGANNAGTVFKITASGAESVLYSFKGGSDGATPEASLTVVGGVLYGTTYAGGAKNIGTVFKITTSGAESVLHSFGDGDGGNPSAGLTNVDGVLYGTTASSVFKITTSGAVSVLYTFTKESEGVGPPAGLTNVDGVLYGTTPYGGGPHNYGIVFKITTSGAESVLYRFKGGSDGFEPKAGLANVNGVLYGTTFYGGTNSCPTPGCGTVFKITTSGTEKVIHSFGGGRDGRRPYAGLTNVNGVLYGTTYNGGAEYDDGTVFKITTAGAKSDLYSFKGGSDGSGPFAGLTYVNGLLYGATGVGGANNKGTVFSLSL